MTMCMNDICTCYDFYEQCMNDRCCGISKHIHLEEDVDALLGDFWLLFRDETDENPAFEREERYP